MIAIARLLALYQGIQGNVRALQYFQAKNSGFTEKNLFFKLRFLAVARASHVICSQRSWP